MRNWKLVIPILFVILLVFFSGYRFTALSAAKSNTFLSKDAKLMEQHEIGSSSIFLFKSDKDQLYRTVLSEKTWVFFRSSVSTYIPYCSDKVQTVGGMSVITKSNAFSFISIKSNDEKVAYIEAGKEPNIERKEINKGQRISFLFPISKQIYSLNINAFDKNGNELYYYGYQKGTNVFKLEDLKWHKIEKQ